MQNQFCPTYVRIKKKKNGRRKLESKLNFHTKGLKTRQEASSSIVPFRSFPRLSLPLSSFPFCSWNKGSSSPKCNSSTCNFDLIKPISTETGLYQFSSFLFVQSVSPYLVTSPVSDNTFRLVCCRQSKTKRIFLSALLPAQSFSSYCFLSRKLLYTCYVHLLFPISYFHFGVWSWTCQKLP